MRVARNTSQNLAREVPVPLPLRGLFVEGKTSEISGMYAAKLENWRSNGFSVELRQAAELQESTAGVIQRIPYSFGANPSLICVKSGSVIGNGISQVYTSTGKLSAAYISGNALLAGGAEGPATFDGSMWWLGGFTTTTGLSPTEFTGVIAHHDRPFFWKEGDDLDFYYGGVGAISGALVQFPLGRLGNIEGTIVGLRSMTVDAGHGMNDVLAIFTSAGNIVAYEGLNPGDTADWRQLNRLKVAPPVSQHAFVQVGGDTWMLTSAGVVSVIDTLRQSKQALVNTVSRPVQKELRAQVEEGGEWSMHLAANGSAVIVNRVFNGIATQHILATDSNAWFTATYPAADWYSLGQETGFTDLSGNRWLLTGQSEEITAIWHSSWFRLPRAGGIEYLVPTILANGPLTMTIAVLTDHDETAADVAEATQTVTISPDDPADVNGQVSINEEIAIDAVGDVFQIRMEVTAAWAEMVSLKAALV